MQIKETRPSKFVIPLSYEIHIDLEDSSRFLHNISHQYEKRLLGEAWSLFWSKFIYSICHPELTKNRYQFRRANQSVNESMIGHNIDKSDIHEAFVVPLNMLERLQLPHDSDPEKIRNLCRMVEVESRPSYDFAAKISQIPIMVPGELLAEAVGFGFNSDGEKEFGIVFSAELSDFYVEEGSLRAAGIVALTFFATTLLEPLVTLAVSTPSTDFIGNKISLHRIEKNLSVQHVTCNVTGGFHFSRTELIMKLEHKLSVGGRSGVCEVQSALAALGYSPGKIDGIEGSDTKAAANAFANAWQLSSDHIGKPVFFNFLARALTGERPPNK